MSYKMPKYSYISSENDTPEDIQRLGVIATQEQCSSSQNSGCGCSNNSTDTDKFIKLAKKSPARVAR